MRIYRRRLPHVDSPGEPVFVTWRLSGSLPPHRAFLGGPIASRAAFAVMDRLLDEARCGPSMLRQPAVARIVQEEILAVAAVGACPVHAYVVMPNHVHVLWTPAISLADVVRLVKGRSARRINLLLGRTGSTFWQSEYFDRLVRSQDEFASVRRYIEWNPVKAGLVRAAEEFVWSSGFGVE
ncbi:transposase [uncultured Paludibaculum sp.]|uniref:REP-associated tyrosine transposase n=1 Tax=uncultured Paludibaculum sp. TaxID=1765020 RepID=UPI002AAACC1A|nr:transposase [uncultured Paludibaculum sp.]